MTRVSRRALLLGSAGGALSVAGSACGSSGSAVGPASERVRRVEAARRTAGQRSVAARLTPHATTVDLGGVVVDTWGYGDTVPGPVVRATASDLLRVTLDNGLAADTSVHWHGIALRNDMDGVPGITQAPIAAGASFVYEFTVPDPGTYFYHPHTGVQLDRGLYGVLVVDDPEDPGDHDLEWIVTLDDWIDGTGRTPDDALAALVAAGADGSTTGGGPMGMGGMDHGSMGMGGGHGGMMSELGAGGDVDHPYHLVDGRVPTAPRTFSASPGQRVRVRLVNAGSDTAYRVALGGHHLTVTHSDGFRVRPATGDAVLVGMGERCDVIVTLGDGVFPLVASAEGKRGQGLALVRTGAGAVPPATARPAELDGRVVTVADLLPADGVALPNRPVERRHDLLLSGTMAPYRWTINGDTFDDAEPLDVREGERVRLRFHNMSMMVHPMHLHGHTFGMAGTGTRKDTVLVRPMESITVDLDADNPGQWAAHCHNVYHAEAGMMTTLSYRA